MICSFPIQLASAYVVVPVSTATVVDFFLPGVTFEAQYRKTRPPTTTRVKNMKNCSAAALSIFSPTSTVSL